MTIHWPHFTRRIVLILLLAFAHIAHADEGLVYDALNLLPYISVLEDTSSALSYEDINTPEQQANFLPASTETSLFHNSTAVYWLKINPRIFAPSEDRYVLYLPYRPVDRLTLYLTNDSKKRIRGKQTLIAETATQKKFVTEYNLTWWELNDGMMTTELRNGLLEPTRFKNGLHIHYRYWIPKKIFDHELPIYLRVENRTQPLVGNLPVYLFDTTHFLQKNLQLHLLSTAYYSVMLCFLLFTFLIFLRIREKFLLYYFSYLLVTICLSTFIDGTYYSVLHEEAKELSYHGFRVALILQGVLYLLFTRSIFAHEQFPPSLQFATRGLLFPGLALAVIGLLLPLNLLTNSIYLLYAGLIAFLVTAIAIVAVVQRYPYGRTLLLMILAHNGFLAAYVLSQQGLLADNLLSPWLAHCAYLSEALLFSLVLASQFIQIRSQAEISNRKYQLAEQEANKEREANLEKSRFLTRASHDLRQPLHSISLFAAALQLKISNQEQKQLTLNMQESIRSMQSMFSDILDISRIEAGILLLQARVIPVNDILQSLYLELAPLADEKQLRLHIRSQKNWLVQSDPILLKRILRNLIINAITYTRSGTVAVGCHYRGQHLRIDVLDSGAGIAPENQHIIFNEFVRADERANEGLGLGLAIVKRLANALHHPIELASSPGKGSRFSISVPLVSTSFGATSSSNVVTSDDSGISSLHSLDDMTIAVIDDDKAVRDSLTAFLDSLGCDVISGRDANSIQQQLATLQRMPDLVIADYYLGQGQTGTAEARYLLEYLGDPTIPVLIITGDTSADTLQHLQSNYINVLNKPVDPALLRQCIEEKVFGT